MESTDTELQEAAARGVSLAVHARRTPDREALIFPSDPAARRTFAELDERVNRCARLLRGLGVGADDGVALVCRNRPEFVEVWQACVRIGARVTAVNRHLAPAEMAYVVDDCEARVVCVDVDCAGALPEDGRPRLILGGGHPSGRALEEALEGVDGSDLDDPVLGWDMLYTSGTTGRPKGVFRKPTGQPAPLAAAIRSASAFDPSRDVSLVTGPLYHAAPLRLNLALPLAAGVPSVVMDRWTPEEMLRLVEEHRVTFTHAVATMFHRLLALDAGRRAAHDVSSLRMVLHGAAPTPVHVKQAMIDWLGPKLYEYYAATEGGTYFVTPEEWLRRPGTVGRPAGGTRAAVLDEHGEPVPAGEVGTIYFEAPADGRFHYFKAPEKTAAAYRGDWFTMGDQGRVDEDGYLFLTGRSAELIISGGVNIYPQEIDDVLVRHPRVLEACTVGAPDEEWGERVVAVVQVDPLAGPVAEEELAEELMAFCRERLAGFKVPREVSVVTEALPRLETGKIQRHVVRGRYWEGRERAI